MEDSITSRKPTSHDIEKTITKGNQSIISQKQDDKDVQIRSIETAEGTTLHRGFLARHVVMIAIGGAIGTGLLIDTGQALAKSGPGSLFISCLFVGFVVFLFMAALGEMAAWLPMSAGFTGYASRFCDPSLGFALGWW